jgi:hypothetical protein
VPFLPGRPARQPQMTPYRPPVLTFAEITFKIKKQATDFPWRAHDPQARKFPFEKN